MIDARRVPTVDVRRARLLLGLVIGTALVAGCANSGAVTLQKPKPQTQPLIVTTPTTPTTPIEVTVPTTIPTTTTTLPPETTTSTTAAPTTTVDPYLVPTPMFPIPALRKGSSGDRVVDLQNRLLQLGFWVDAADGHYGLATSQAVMAFQKYYGVSNRSGTVDQATADALNTVTTKPRPQSADPDVIEVNKALQVLHIIHGGQAIWTINVSTGSSHAYTELSKKEPGKVLKGDAITPDGTLQGQPGEGRRLVGGRARPALPAQVLPWRHRGARLEQHPQLPGEPRLRAGQHAGHGLHLGPEPDADRHGRLGAQLSPTGR